jgi:hypothetical protein
MNKKLNSLKLCSNSIDVVKRSSAGSNGVTSGQMGLLQVKWGYFGSNGLTSGQMGLLRVKWGYFGSNGVTSGQMGFNFRRVGSSNTIGMVG